jgi:hypothetical protein
MIEPQTLTGRVQGALLRPERASDLGVIVLSGSSGRVDVDRARLFAERGAVSLAQRWWGGEGQAASITQVPLELFVAGVDRLKAEGCARIAMVGTSKGAEAALLAATIDPRIDLVVAVSPTHVVWQNMGPAWPPTSSFTLGGAVLPFIVYDPRGWPAAGTPRPSYRPMWEKSLATFAEDVPAATIAVERARAEIILVAGGADLLWPSDTAAHAIAARLQAHGKTARLIEHPGAGHSPVFPGEPARQEPLERAWGGSPAADAELGAAAWAEIAARLNLTD